MKKENSKVSLLILVL